MPVSPQDFALWSNLTGNPYPRTPAERMMLAPQVHMFNQDLARGKNPLGQAVEGIGSAIDFAGRAALGVGLLAGAGLLAGKYIDSRKGKESTPVANAPSASQDIAEEVKASSVTPTPQEFARSKAASVSKYAAARGAAYAPIQSQMDLELDNEPEIGLTVVEAAPDLTSQVAQASGDITNSMTSEKYRQNSNIGSQSTEAQIARGTSPTKPTVVDSESKPATQSEVISTGQTFSPGTELDQLATRQAPHTPVRDRADELIAEFLGGVSAEQRAQKRIDQSVAEYAAGVAGKGERVLKQVLKEGREEGISPVGMKSVQAAETFRQTPEYITMMRGAGASMEPEELVGAPGAEVVLSSVRPTTSTRVAGVEPVEVESPIAAMTKPAAVVVESSPVAVTVASKPAPSVIEGASPETIDLAKKAFGHLPLEQAVSLLTKKGSSGAITTSQPSTLRVSESQAPTGKEFLERKIAGGLPQATPRGSAQQALAEFSELYEGQTNPERVAASAQPSSSFIEYARVYPGNLMGVKLKNASIEYGHKVDPEFTPYLTEMIKRGEFYGKDYNELKALGLIKSPALGHEKGEF